MTDSLKTAPATAEAIRMVIWDLDDTFWHGTVVEEGYVYNQAAHEIVVELARRGIVSSICSKNDALTIEAILKKEGIWEYFIFPSIDWSPKGPRILSLIEAVKLRPETVLFIDDNPRNLGEAKEFCPRIQIGGPEIISSLLENPLLRGAPDQDMRRLAGYKVIERKHTDAKGGQAEGGEFLRQSNIRVYIDHNVEQNLERAVELINRTNQLNFTKVRLPESIPAAVDELKQALASRQAAPGLVYAADKYGDYGCIGFYLLRNAEHGRHLVHFCFSCRTLGMRIETWLYERLGKPRVTVKGEVLTDLADTTVDVDWVTEVFDISDLQGEGKDPVKLDKLIVHGGCDTRSVEHYIEGLFTKTFEEMNEVVNNLEVRTDHSVFLRHAIAGVSEEAIQGLAPFNFLPKHFASALSELSSHDHNVVLLSLWSDGRVPLYRDRRSGADVPILLPGQSSPNIIDADISVLERDLKRPDLYSMAMLLREHFDFVGPIPLADYEATIISIANILHENTFVVVMQTPEYWYKHGSDETWSLQREPLLNAINRDVFAKRANVLMLNPHEFAASRDEYLDFFHFTRPVYQRIGMHIRIQIELFFAAASRTA